MPQVSPLANPVNFIDPTLQTQQAQLDRRQALAAQLRQASLQDTPSNGGRISWTQGAARLAEALVAKSMQKKADASQSDLAAQYGRALGGMFGARGGTPPVSDGNSAPPESSMSLSLPATDQSVDIPPQPQASPAAAPAPASTPADAGAPSRGPLSLTGDPQFDMSMYAMAPDKYMEGVIASHAPGDFVKMLQQAGIDPNSPIGKQLIQGNIAKQNYTPPINGRPGSTIRDPYDPSHVIGYDAPNIEGAFPNYDANGMPTGYTQAPGAAGAIAGVTAAKAGANAGFEPIQVFNPQTGQMEYSNKANVSQNGAQAAPRPGYTAASDVTGKQSATQFGAVSEAAQDVPNRILALNQMAALVNDPRTVLGPGSPGVAHVRGVLGTIGQTMGIGSPPVAVDNAQEFNKWASQYSARSAAELGLSGSDARMNLAVHATPNGEMQPGALKSIIPQMIGFENAKMGRAQAANAWQQSHGPDTFQQFSTAWNKNYDPRIYTWMAQGPQAFAKSVSGMPKAEAAQLREKYIALRQIGALPQ